MTPRRKNKIWDYSALVGETFEQYQILLLIQKTELFAYYKAFDINLGKKITLMTFTTNYNYSNSFVSDLKSLVEIKNVIDHPNIGKIIEVAQIDNILFVAYDFVPRITFSQRYHAPISPNMAINAVVPIAQALIECHNNGVFHGQIKPEAMLVNEDNQVMLVDFGIERLTIEYIASLLPGNWLPFVNHVYQAPEQILTQTISRQTEIYSLGLIFAELVSGYKPYSSYSILEGLVKRVIYQKDILAIDEEVLPEQTRKFIGKAINFLPGKRFPTFASFVDSIKQLQTGVSIKKEKKKPSFKRILSYFMITILVIILFFIGGATLNLWSPNTLSSIWKNSPFSIIEIPTPKNELIVEESPTQEVISAEQTIIEDASSAAVDSQTSMSDEYPILFNERFPDIKKQITTGNIQQVIPLAQWGLGSLNQMNWTPDGEGYILSTSIGVFGFDTSFEDMKYFGISDWVNCVEFSKDGSIMLTGTRDGLIQILDTEGEQFETFGGHAQSVNSLSFSPGDKLFASASDDKTIKIWDLKSKENTQILNGHLGAVEVVKFSPNGQKIISGSADNTIKIWDVTTGEMEINISVSGTASSISISPDGKLLVAADSENIVKFFDAASGNKLPSITNLSSKIKSVSFNPEGDRLAVGELNGNISVWNAQNLELLWSKKYAPMPFILGNNFDYVHEVVFSPDGSKLASALWDNTIHIVDADDGSEYAVMDEFGDFNQSLTFSPDSTMLATQTITDQTKIWDIQNGKVIHIVDGTILQGKGFSNNSKLLALKGDSQTIYIYDTKSGDMVYKLNGHNSVYGIAFSDNDYFLAAGSGKDYKIWSMNTGLEVITTPTVYYGCSYTVSVDEKKLAVGNSLNYLMFSNSKDLCKISKPSWVTSMDLNDEMVVFGGTNMISIENYSTNPTFGTFPGYSVTAVDSSYDKKMILAGLSDKSIRIWNVSSTKELFNVISHNSSPTAVQFSMDNRLIATTALDGTIRIWGIP